jgi:hypothetical protein
MEHRGVAVTNIDNWVMAVPVSILTESDDLEL